MLQDNQLSKYDSAHLRAICLFVDCAVVEVKVEAPINSSADSVCTQVTTFTTAHPQVFQWTLGQLVGMGLFQETFIEGSIWMIFHEHVYNVCAQVFTQKSKPSDHRCVWSNATRRGSTMARAVSGGFYRWLSFWFGLAVQLLSYFHRWLCFNLFLWTYPNHPHFPWFCISQIKE